MTSGSVDTTLPLPLDPETRPETPSMGERLRSLASSLDADAPLLVRLAAGAVAGVVGYLLSELTQLATGEATIILSMVPVALVAYRFGFLAGVVATGVAFGLGLAFVLPPEGLPIFEDAGQATRLSISASVFVAMCLLADRFRHSQLQSSRLLVASEELRREAAASELRWRVLAETMPGLVAQSDATGRMTFYNRRYEEFTGLSAEELRDDPASILHPEDVERLTRSMREVYLTGKPRKEEWRVRSAAGEYRWHTGYAAPELGVDGRVLSVVGGAIDIHDRKVAEQGVESQRALLDTIITAAPVGIGVWDRDYRCVTINDALVRMNGIDRDQTIGRRPQEYMPDHWPQVQPYFELAIAGEETVGIEMEATNAAGEWTAIVASYYPVRTGAEVTGVALVCTDVRPQHTARRELTRSEERYRQLTEAMPAMVSLIDSKGRSYFWNKAFFDYTGLSIEQALDWWNEGLVIQEDVQAIAATWTRQVTEGLPAEAEVRVRRSDGEYCWHHVRAVPFGMPAQWMLVATDIDDRKRGEERLREFARKTAEARARLDAIVRQAPLGIAFLDLEGRIVHVNETIAEFDAIPVADHLNKPLAELLPRLWEQIEPTFEQIRSGESEFIQFEHTGRSRVEPRDMRTWNFRWYPVKDPSGEIFGVSVLVEDITERKRAESAAHFLEDATQQLAASLDYEQNLARVAELAVEHLSDVCVIDVFPNDGRVMRAATATKTPEASEFVSGIQLRDWRINGGNDTFGARILRGQEFFVADVTEEWLQEHAPGPSQVGAARALGATSLLAIPLRVKGEVVGAFTLVMAGSGRKFSQQDQALARELATRLAFAVENSRLFDEAQQALAALRESDEWLRAANAAKDEFLSLVSHELRTPITTILGNASVIQRHGRQLAEDDLASAIGDIHHDASRLNGIIDNLLALARLERGQQVEVEPLVLRRIARRVVESHRSEHPDREYRVAFPEEMILVEGNAVYMEQVLRNLLSNAERYSPEGSPIDIEATRSNGTLRFSVMDRGVGIDPDEAQKLFEPFFRSSRTSGMKGIGVGLAVCKRLVEFQGGTLVAASREGGGSVFTVSLPVTSLDEQES